MSSIPRTLEPTPPETEQSQRDRHVTDQRREIPLSERTYLTPAETVTYLGLPSVNALKHRMKRGTIPTWCWTRMGGSLRFVRSSIDQWLGDKARTAAAVGLVHSGQSAPSLRVVQRKARGEAVRERGGR